MASRFRFLSHCFAALVLIFLFSSNVVAQKTAEVGAAAEGEIFDLPTEITDLAQVMKFVQEIDAIEPTGSSEQEVVAHQRKVARSVVAIADKALKMNFSDRDAMQSVYLKLQGLQILVELGEPKADQMLTEAIEAAQTDKRPDVQAIGMKFMIESGFAQWNRWGDKEKAALIEKIIQFVSKSEPTTSQLQLCMSVVDFLGDVRGNAYAQQLLESLVPHFAKSKDPEIQEAMVMIRGIERRLNLPGNAMELSGWMLDESQLDWSSYRGKVVLVDFWATWCGPCRAEVPNVLKMYEAYHDKGFEVLGISLDTKREQAESYIEQTGIPWPTLFSKNPEERGWQHPMAVNYGITGIPRAILVDRDGKVVHMNARGPNLGRELRRLLGEPVARAQPRHDAWIQQVSGSAPAK